MMVVAVNERDASTPLVAALAGVAWLERERRPVNIADVAI
jgi:hypothetical protein